MKTGPAQKHEREAVRLVCALRQGIRAEVQTRPGKNAHKWLIATLESTSVRVCLSGSPRDPDTWLKQVRSNVLRAFRERGLDIAHLH